MGVLTRERPREEVCRAREPSLVGSTARHRMHGAGYWASGGSLGHFVVLCLMCDGFLKGSGWEKSDICLGEHLQGPGDESRFPLI